MVRHPKALARRQERTESRREQVLDAAQSCFLVEGFHRASMVRIADAAAMSVGHIYRYFESKDAIIIALCERRFAGFEELLTAIEDNERPFPSGLVDAWISQFVWWIHPQRAPLTLEIMSEAGRNTKVAEVVRTIDRRFRDMMRRSILPSSGAIPEDEIEDRLEAVTMLAHGMTIRLTADPEADPDRLLEAFRRGVHELLALPYD
jgi:AcrR family transcriptional regulator